jgi:hypothetical protein
MHQTDIMQDPSANPYRALPAIREQVTVMAQTTTRLRANRPLHPPCAQNAVLLVEGMVNVVETTGVTERENVTTAMAKE